MRMDEEYRLSMYSDQGFLDEERSIKLKRNRLDGTICVEKHVPLETEPVYAYLKAYPYRNVPYIYECIRDERERCLVIIEEYITGMTLEQVLMERDVPVDEAVDIVLSLCGALEPLHSARPPIICRDLKADNIMADKDGVIKIVDFDIARVYQQGKHRDTVLLGTADYAAPEQFGFRQTDPRTDIYALGVLLNYLITRRYPSDALAEGKVKPVIVKCTRMDPDQRYRSVRELAGELERICPGRAGRQRQGSRDMSDWILPGFRTKTWWKMIIAVFVYAILAKACFTIETVQDGVPLKGIHLFFEQVTLFISQVIFICVLFDYRGWRSRLPLAGSRNQIIRIAGCIAAEIVISLLWGILCAVVRMAVM